MKRQAATYWREVCAPKLKAKKDELGRSVPERDIAAAVETASRKRTTRGLISLFLLGEREPYISQFMALCQKLGLDPLDVLGKETPQSLVPLSRINEKGVRKRTQKSHIQAKTTKSSFR